MAHKNDYSISYFHNNERVLFLKYVHNIYKSCKWLETQGIEFSYMNVYDRRTGQFLKRLWFEVNGIRQFIPQYL